MRKLLFGIVISLCLTGTLAYAVPYDWNLVEEHINQHGGGYKYSIRGLATAKNGSTDIYYGHIQNAYDGVLTDGTLNIVRMDTSGNMLGSVTVTNQAKALETDDRGYVYASSANGVDIYSADLDDDLLGSFTVDTTGNIEGMAIAREGENYFLYATIREEGKIVRYDVTDLGNPAIDTAWAVDGIYTMRYDEIFEEPLPEPSLRNAVVDMNGNIWVADKSNDILFKIAADGSGYQSVEIDDVMDIAVCCEYAYVSREDGNSSSIYQLDIADMSFIQELVDPMVDTGYGSHYGFAGMDILDGKLYVADEDAWRVDGLTGYGDEETAYGDYIYTVDIPGCGTSGEENVPEPATIFYAAVASLGLCSVAIRRLKK